MVEIRLADHSFPPFGAQIFNQKGQEVGIVGDSGSAYVSGINANEVMSVQWGGDAQCQITFPEPLQNSEHALLLPCRV
ncbi:FimD/PapC C-terminal domain-containing protein [Providencia thailandensis]|uniref:FimD/PapC C-terminal domain-containing protein n=2 Tax=Providencia stuartii TaxID=588 RepID=A0AAJ1N210_PROST|nr:FimD/PapC C-terminal domain-containing protein [Providencia thailandensis]MDE8748800.1 FimD/PapC C-terminal domain-containing protein [Providencia thailandensis]MDE8768100.1 FimD/PapC C-terminal domain-containing protein [Providencia thailandensis]MDE8772636.1 FimD/PapC C-terminal domain-containing protein [Providencia thailandensis]MDE8788604.1 FimD/PapC C-terminal domain-containing protein [Providencia thailandensis]